MAPPLLPTLSSSASRHGGGVVGVVGAASSAAARAALNSVAAVSRRFQTKTTNTTPASSLTSSYSSAAAAATPNGSRPVRRFPLPHLHVGTDICHVGRIYRLLQGPATMHGGRQSKTSPSSSSSSFSSPSQAARFVRRILTPDERPPDVPTRDEALPSNATASQILAWILAGRSVGAPREEEEEEELVVVSRTKGDHGADTARRCRDPLLWKAAQFLAGRFAAKEAAIKAHPHLDLSFHSVRIVRARDDKDNGSGPPVAMIRVGEEGADSTREKNVEGEEQEPGQHGCSHVTPTPTTTTTTQAYDQEARLSISHDGEYATAVCIGFEDR